MGTCLTLTRTHNMTQSPLALKRRREAERPPGIPNTKKQNNEAKDKKNSSIGSVLLEYLYLAVGFLWYSLVGLWRRAEEGQYEARLTLSKALYTPSQLVVRNHGQQEVYEMVQQAVSKDGRDGGHKGYFLVNGIGYDVISLDPEHLIPNLNW